MFFKDSGTTACC